MSQDGVQTCDPCSAVWGSAQFGDQTIRLFVQTHPLYVVRAIGGKSQVNTAPLASPTPLPFLLRDD